MNTFISYKDKQPVLTHKLQDAVSNSDDKTRICMFIDDKLVFNMWHNVVVDMIANKSIVSFFERRKKQLGIE